MIYLLIAVPTALLAGALWGYAIGAEMTERRLRRKTGIADYPIATWRFDEDENFRRAIDEANRIQAAHDTRVRRRRPF